jgi:aminotransferase EvaB
MQSSDRIPFNDLARIPPEQLEQIEAAIAAVVRSGWFVMGPHHDAFEEELASYLGSNEVIAVANGTDALELALAALGVTVGDSVLTVANAGGYTTVASRLLGANPIYCDVSADTLLASPDIVRNAIAALAVPPKALVVTHLYGAMAPIEKLVAVAREFGVAVVEDCAQSLGAQLDGRQSGTFGDIATTSFYPTKNLGALGDGGAVFTDNAELAERVRRMRQYGWTSKYRIGVEHGRNSRMDEIQAAILRVKLPHLKSRNSRRREIHARYGAALGGGARLLHAPTESFTAHLSVLVTEERDSVRDRLSAAGIGTDIHYPLPDHLQVFRPESTKHFDLPISEWAANSVLSLPLFPELTETEISRIESVLADL